MKKIVVIGIIAGAVVAGWYFASLRPVDGSSEERTSAKIEAGASLTQIANLLHEKRVIRSPMAFKVYAKLNGYEGNLQAGTFILRPSMNVGEIASILKSGKAEEMLITIPEGFTVSQIDSLLAEKGLITEGDITKCAIECDFSSFEFLPNEEGISPFGGRVEGYLFPETYFVSADEFVPKFFLERMLTTFRNNVLSPLDDQIKSSGRPLHRIITVASLIEEEASGDEERPVISGIMWKRYEENLGLGVDATVRYILQKPLGELTTADLNFNSPYNTRKFKGLPPGPIASPGENSILASISPAESEYWYYLHGKDGTVHYAVTNEEHNVNKYLYLK